MISADLYNTMSFTSVTICDGCKQKSDGLSAGWFELSTSSVIVFTVKDEVIGGPNNPLKQLKGPLHFCSLKCFGRFLGPINP
jgi:hypothetical protein